MHLYTCSCGETIPVALSRAGQDITCPACSATLTLPKLGDLRALPLAEEPSDQEAASKWSGGRGLVFSTLAVVFLICAGYGTRCTIAWLSIPVQPTVEEQIAQGHEKIDKQDIGGLHDFWLDQGSPGLTKRQTLSFDFWTKVRNIWRGRAYGCYAGACGSLLAIWFVLPKRSKP